MNYTNTTETTIRSYNACIDRYVEKFMDFASYTAKSLHFQTHYLAEGATILDLGCGPGNVAKLLLEQNSTYKITGVDLSGEMLKVARRNAPNAQFHTADLREFTSDTRFDAVIASFSIVHLTNNEAQQLLTRLHTLLQPGGYLYLSFMEGRTAGFETTSFSDNALYYNYYDRNYIQALLRESALETVELLEDDYLEADGSVTKDVFIIAQYHH